MASGSKTQDAGPAPKAPPRLPSPVKTQSPGPAPKIISSKVPDRGPAPKVPPSVPRPSPGGDVQSGGGYGVQSARANAYKQTAAYKQAIVATFLHQPKAQASAILRGALSRPSYEGNLILKYVHQNSGLGTLKRGGALSGPALEGSVLPIDKGLSKATDFVGSGLSRLFPGHSTGQGSGSLLGSTTPFAKGTFGRQLTVNSLKDAVNLPGEAVSTVGLLGGDILHHDFGKLGHDLISGPKNFVEHPGTILQHPLDAYLTFAGPVHGGTRIAAAAARRIAPKSALGRAVSPSIPPSVELTGNLTKERPNYSAYPLIKGGQKIVEKGKYKRSPNGLLVPRRESIRSRQIRQGVSQRIGMNERIRRVQIAMQERAHSKAVMASKPMRAAHAVKTTLKYNPQPAFIRGAGVLSLIAQGVIRRPQTAVADLARYIDKVSANRSGLADFPEALKEHDATVKALRVELGKWRADKNLERNLGPAFAAAESHGRAYAPLESQAHDFGHFGKDVTKSMLERRVLTPIVHEHMPGARFDPERQTMVVDTPIAGAGPELARLRARAQKLQESQRRGSTPGERAAAERALHATWERIAQLETHKTRVLSTGEMRAFANAHTGGRTLSYGSHQAPKGDSAFYVRSDKFPAKAVQRNTMFAFRHGLIDPSHQALLQGRVHLQGVVGAHESMGRLLGLLTEKRKDGGYWPTYAKAKLDAPPGYVPVNVGRIHGYAEHVSPNDAVNAMSIEQEALTHSLDLNARLQPSEQAGKWALIHKTAVDQIRKHENQISPNAVLRGFRGTTNQFRKVALGTSAKHIPGVAQENLIRDIASGVFVHHWFAERNAFRAAEKINPELARQRRIELTGGQVAGATRALATRQVARHFEGTPLEGPLKGFEKLMRAPGPRQLSTAWNTWLHFAIDGTKHVLEEQHQRAAVGKQLLDEFGRLGRLQGEAARIAAEKGYLPDRMMRQLRAGTERMFGRWTDQTPEAITALMVSPFGMWWVNSMRWLGRLAIDHPIHTAVLASANVSTEKQRLQLGLDMFAPGHLPLYEQGGIPSGKNIIAQNYYSPFGVANDPLETMQSLILPTLTPQILASLGDNWLGRQMKSPQHKHGGETNPGQRAAVILNSVLGNLIPLYQKAQTIAQGGASSYDTSTLWNVQTKGPNPGPLPGLERALTPLRKYKNIGNKGHSSGPTDPFKNTGTTDPFQNSGASSGAVDPFK